MIAALMFYGIVVSTLVALAAVAAEWLARRAEIRVRWIWTAAMLAMLGFIGVAPFRGSTPLKATLNLAGAQGPQIASTASGGFSLEAVAQRVAGFERDVLLNPMMQSIGFVQSRLPESAGNYLIALWVIATATLAALMIAVCLRFKRERRGWPVTTLCGVHVRVAPDVGPAVIGVVRPDIVVPHWLLARTNDEQKLVIAHETEHMRALDPLLLAFGCAVVAIVPWNPAAWWMLSRLRLAVELDCDARVLSAGVAPRKYGDLLIDLAEHRSGFRVSVAALADDSSHLEQRLIAMKPDFLKYARTRAVVVSVLAAAALLVACDATVPTSADVAKMDVTSAQRSSRSAFMMKTGQVEPVYTLDNVVVSAAFAKSLSPDKIASIDMVGPADGKRGEVRIVSDHGAGQLLHASKSKTSAPDLTFSGLVLVNGMKTDMPAFKNIDPTSIASVQVTKAPFAAKKYSDPLAVNGVISITTKLKTAR